MIVSDDDYFLPKRRRLSTVGQTRDACMACNLRLLKLAFWARYSAHTLRTAAVKTATDRINGKLLSSKKLDWHNRDLL